MDGEIDKVNLNFLGEMLDCRSTPPPLAENLLEVDRWQVRPSQRASYPHWVPDPIELEFWNLRVP